MDRITGKNDRLHERPPNKTNNITSATHSNQMIMKYKRKKTYTTKEAEVSVDVHLTIIAGKCWAHKPNNNVFFLSRERK